MDSGNAEPIYTNLVLVLGRISKHVDDNAQGELLQPMGFGPMDRSAMEHVVTSHCSAGCMRHLA